MLTLKLCPHVTAYIDANGYAAGIEVDCRECGALAWHSDPDLIQTTVKNAL